MIRPTPPVISGEHYIPMGWYVEEAIEWAIEYVKRDGYSNEAMVSFEFNGVSVAVKQDSTQEDLYIDWIRAQKGVVSPNIGPYAAPRFEYEEVINYFEVLLEEAECDRIYMNRIPNFSSSERVNEPPLRVQAYDSLDAIKIADKKAWHHFLKMRSDCRVTAERWAQLMQPGLSSEDSFADVAERAYRQAAIREVTKEEYELMVRALKSAWEYGKELGHWYKTEDQAKLLYLLANNEIAFVA